MRRAALIGFLLLAGACIPRGTSPAGNPTGIGVLVQATAGRCTTVVVGTNRQRVCPIRQRRPGQPATQPDTTRTDSTRVTRNGG
jgi:hypothetical protein